MVSDQKPALCAYISKYQHGTPNTEWINVSLTRLEHEEDERDRIRSYIERVFGNTLPRIYVTIMHKNLTIRIQVSIVQIMDPRYLAILTREVGVILHGEEKSAKRLRKK